jgi:tetratricopeptide (TPR) repeat protein
MFIHIKSFSRFLLLICLVGLACISAGSTVFGQSAPASNNQEVTPRFPGIGLRVTEVYGGSPAERAGLQYGDIISQYGKYELLDEATYFVARDAYEKFAPATVQVLFWRNARQMTATVLPGRLGVEWYEYNTVSSQFYSIIEKANMMIEVRDDGRERLFEGIYTPPEKLIEEARNLLERAEHDGTLTPVQLLVARIHTTLDNAAPEDLKKQAALLAQLCSTQPDSYVTFLSQGVFEKHKRYRAARECYKQHLKVDPSAVSFRLNLGVVSNELGLFDEADAAVDYVFKNNQQLSEHGFLVGYQVKALAALGHRDYAKSISFAEKAFELDRTTFNISLVQLAAARSGDLQSLGEASRKFKEVLPTDYERRKFQVDAVEAFALVRNNQRDLARNLILKWKDTDGIESRLSAYWKRYPGGSDVLKTWKELMQN